MLIAECGAHPATRRESLPTVILKVGTFDDPGPLDGPRMAIYMFCPPRVQWEWYRDMELTAG